MPLPYPSKVSPFGVRINYVVYSPKDLSGFRITFITEKIDGPFYHYSHGLKKHKGNCQRIAHGHRSKIEIWKDGRLDLPLMESWAAQWTDIYLGTHEDLIKEEKQHLYFAYESQQGKFSLSLPMTNAI